MNLLANIVIMAANVEENLEELEAIVDGVSFFYEEGKGGENYRKRNKFRCKVKKEEKSLQKLKNTVW